MPRRKATVTTGSRIECRENRLSSLLTAGWKARATGNIPYG